MAEKRVVVLYSRSLFAAGIQIHLQSLDCLEVISVDAADLGALEQIQEVAPDVIIIDALDGGFVSGIAISELLSLKITAKIISLDLENPEISIFHHEIQQVMSKDELIDAIRN